MRWAELLDENMPQELHRSIEEQKAACAEISASKVTNKLSTKIVAGYIIAFSTIKSCTGR